MKKIKLLTFSELDDVFFDFFENKVVSDGYYIKFLDCQPKQIVTEKKYNLSALKNYDLYRDQHYDDYINYFRHLFELFDCIYVDYPLQTFIKDSLIDDTADIVETFFPFLNLNETIILVEKKMILLQM